LAPYLGSARRAEDLLVEPEGHAGLRTDAPALGADVRLRLQGRLPPLGPGGVAEFVPHDRRVMKQVAVCGAQGLGCRWVAPIVEDGHAAHEQHDEGDRYEAVVAVVLVRPLDREAGG